MQTIRNIAIIAHVDHGKTTLIDSMFRQSGVFQSHQKIEERILDSNAIEKERGITILSKCTSIFWQDHKINIIDTPGHADFGGEVERVLSMADSALLLVDAAEGPLPQTKFVLGKALKLGLRPIVLINKIDRADARPQEVLDEVFELFLALEANDEQLDFPYLYASGRDGWSVKNLGEPQENLSSLFELIISHVPIAEGNVEEPFRLLVTTLESDPYLGRILTGRIISGLAKMNMMVKAMNLRGEEIERARLTKLLSFDGVKRIPIEGARAGDIICIAGLGKSTVSDTIADITISDPVASTPVDPPTMAITISVNDSPLAGLEGTKVTSRMIRDRLLQEAEGNVAIRVRESDTKDSFEVGGRGELQLGVLIETMRREGFELSVSRPRVLFQIDSETGKKLEPIEEIVIDVDEEFSGAVIDKLTQRKAELQEMRPSGGSKTRLVFYAPSRGLIGYQGEFLTDTRGTGVLNRLFHNYAPYKGDVGGRRNGVLISNSNGEAVAYAIWNLEDRGIMFVTPQQKVYEGMIIGEHNRNNDLEVNILKGKQLTNIRAAGSDENIRLTPPKLMSLEEMMSYIEDDELVEVTPKSLRLRKRILNPHDRKRESRKSEQEG